MLIISCRVSFRSPAAITMPRSWSVGVAPAGGCHRWSSSTVQPTAISATARSLSDRGFRSRKRRPRVTAAWMVGSVRGPAAVRTRRPARATESRAMGKVLLSRGGRRIRRAGSGWRTPRVAAMRVRPMWSSCGVDGRSASAMSVGGRCLSGAGRAEQRNVVRHRAGCDLMPGGDRSQILSGVVEQAVVIEHYQRLAVFPRTEHLLRQPGHHSSRGDSRLDGCTTHWPKLPTPADPGSSSRSALSPVAAGGRRGSTRALTASAAYRKRGEVAAAMPQSEPDNQRCARVHPESRGDAAVPATPALGTVQ